jgi:hypothetical protein
MIYTITMVDNQFKAAWEPAGEPDQEVIEQHAAKHKHHQPRQPKIKRWYYLLKEDSRISLRTAGQPLEDWPQENGAKILVGTGEIIGEFPGNQENTGKLGLRILMEPIEWLQGEANKYYYSGTQFLANIDVRILERQRGRQQ